MSIKRLGFSVVILHILIRAYIIMHLFNRACTSLDSVQTCFMFLLQMSYNVVLRVMWTTRNRVCFFRDKPLQYTRTAYSVTISRPSISIGGQMTSSLYCRRGIKEPPYRCTITADFANRVNTGPNVTFIRYV